MLAMESPMLRKLRISAPPPSEREVEETRKALSEGLDICRQEGNPQPSLKALIWRLLQDAAETLARLPDKERVWLLSSDRVIWPELARPSEDNRAVEWETAMEQLAGVRSPDTPAVRLMVSDPSAPRRMLTVLGWLKCVRGRTPQRIKRDKLVVLALAQGQSYRAVRRYMGKACRDSAILAVKSKVLSQMVEMLVKAHV